jgi:hypothetical protein
VQARVILAVLAALFLLAAVRRWARNGRRPDPATRTWLLVALVFAAVAAWLQWHTS